MTKAEHNMHNAASPTCSTVLPNFDYHEFTFICFLLRVLWQVSSPGDFMDVIVLLFSLHCLYRVPPYSTVTFRELRSLLSANDCNGISDCKVNVIPSTFWSPLCLQLTAYSFYVKLAADSSDQSKRSSETLAHLPIYCLSCSVLHTVVSSTLRNEM